MVGSVQDEEVAETTAVWIVSRPPLPGVGPVSVMYTALSSPLAPDRRRGLFVPERHEPGSRDRGR